MPRVLMLSTDLERGGLPLRLVRLAERLRGTGIEPVVVCLTREGPLSKELRQGGIETFACDAGGRFDLSCLWRLARVVRRYAPDVIHASLFHANIAARLTGRVDRPRPIITSSVTIEIERAWHRWGEAATIGASDLHVANSRAVARHLVDELGFPEHKVVVVPNGIDFGAIERTQAIGRAELGIDADTFLIVWAGRMDPVKDLATLVAAVERFARTHKATALLLGDGPERGRVVAMIRARGLGGVIRMAGWVECPAAYVKAANCLLFPSRTEGSPNAVLEAMACGCPVVTSDIPACAELVRDGESGLLCRAGDADGFADALLQTAARPVRAKVMAQAARAAAAGHDLGRVVRQWVDLYERVLG